MFNTTNLIKLGAAAAGALLILLFANWGAESLYKVAADEGHGGEEHAAVRGYDIAPNAGEDTGAQEEVVQVSFEEVYASADPGKGERVFNKCKACHKLDGNNATGPHLDGVVDRPIASVDGFAYSDALASLDGNWTPQELDHWLEDPKGYAPGNKMTFNGLNKIEDRANLIAYLATTGG